MSFSDKLFYTKDHEWVEKIEGSASIGVSSFAVEQLGDVVHIELPKVGQNFKAGDSFGTIESTKTVSDLYMPVGGVILEVNSALCKTPEKIQEDSYEKGWLIKVEIKEVKKELLMSATDYKNYVDSH